MFGNVASLCLCVVCVVCVVCCVWCVLCVVCGGRGVCVV